MERVPRQSLAVNIHCEFSSRFHSDSKRIRSGFESKRRESPRIRNVFAQQYGFANFGRVFTVIHCETLSWGCGGAAGVMQFVGPWAQWRQSQQELHFADIIQQWRIQGRSAGSWCTPMSQMILKASRIPPPHAMYKSMCGECG